jgi:hypothetical protein
VLDSNGFADGCTFPGHYAKVDSAGKGKGVIRPSSCMPPGHAGLKQYEIKLNAGQNLANVLIAVHG